jgi:hypothetical protein
MPVNYHYSYIGQVVGSMFALALPPTLNIMDMIWISYRSLSGHPESTTSRQNKLAASIDPVALDFHTGKYVLYPVSQNPDHHPEMMDQYKSSNFGYHIEDAADVINENGGLFGKSVNFRETNMTPVKLSNPVQVQIKLSGTEPTPGVDLKVSYRITNPGFSREVDFYFAIKIGNSYYFYPDWTTTPKPNTIELPGNSNPAFTEIISIPITDQTPAGTYMFAAAVTERGTTNVLGFVDYQEFTIPSAVPLSDMVQRSMSAMNKPSAMLSRIISV